MLSIDSTRSSSRRKRESNRTPQYIKDLRIAKRVTKIDSSRSSSRRKRRRNNYSIKKPNYYGKTRKELYNIARTRKKQRRICSKRISKMKKDQLIRFLNTF